MLFFDLEFYVPGQDRESGSFSFKYNPNIDTHKLLGGTFYSKTVDGKIPDDAEFVQLWLWDHNNDERLLLESIYKLFKEEWVKTIKENKTVLKKPVNTALICGIGISWADMPILYLRSLKYKIDTPEELYNIYFKSRFIELSNTCSFLFPEERILYPKTAREINTKMRNNYYKDKSITVWDLFDNKKTDEIEKRTTQELINILLVYDKIQNDIFTKRLNQFNSFSLPFYSNNTNRQLHSHNMNTNKNKQKLSNNKQLPYPGKSINKNKPVSGHS
jgi:hypothetical protein